METILKSLIDRDVRVSIHGSNYAAGICGKLWREDSTVGDYWHVTGQNGNEISFELAAVKNASLHGIIVI